MALVAAISLVMSVSFIVQGSLAYLLLSRRIGSLRDLKLTSYAFQVLGAALLAGAAGYLVLSLLGGVSEGSFSISSGLNALISCLVIGGVSLLVYVCTLWLAKNLEVRSVVTAVRGIFRR
jgi:putative peptidoglycan lipid II flippase